MLVIVLREPQIGTQTEFKWLLSNKFPLWMTNHKFELFVTAFLLLIIVLIGFTLPSVTSLMDDPLLKGFILRGERRVKRMPLRWWERSNRWRWGWPTRSRRWRRSVQVSPSGRFFRSPWWTGNEKKNYKIIFLLTVLCFSLCYDLKKIVSTVWSVSKIPNHYT